MAMSDPTNAAVIDRTAVFEYFEDDMDLIRDIVRLFLDACPRRLSAIREAVALGDAEALQAAAHSMRGSASNFGAAAVVAAALRLEVMGRTGNLGDAAEACKVLEQESARLQSELQALCNAASKEVH
jgi:HPt (histidine-containing phosphotransfer) domain-containing protein